MTEQSSEYTVRELPIKGRTIVKIEPGMGDASDGEINRIRITLDDGTQWMMMHEQNCCERVHLADVTGDVQDLIGSTLVVAEERSRPGDDDNDDDFRSSTWTFYDFRTVRGSVTLRWIGESNGYYSEDVDFDEVTPREDDTDAERPYRIRALMARAFYPCDWSLCRGDA